MDVRRLIKDIVDCRGRVPITPVIPSAATVTRACRRRKCRSSAALAHVPRVQPFVSPDSPCTPRLDFRESVPSFDEQDHVFPFDHASEPARTAMESIFLLAWAFWVTLQRSPPPTHTHRRDPVGASGLAYSAVFWCCCPRGGANLRHPTPVVHGGDVQ